MIETGLKVPDGIAVDWVSRHIYFTESSAHRIDVANFDGTNRAFLMSANLTSPRGTYIYLIGPYNAGPMSALFLRVALIKAGVMWAILKREYYDFETFFFRNLVYCILSMYPFFLTNFMEI